MSEIAKTTGVSTTSGVHPIPQPEAAAHEAYSFACMKCGYGWEQAYEIVHQVDGKGELHVVYYADGERVPSPLTCPTCLNCGTNVVRIMRSGQVSMVSDAIANMHQRHNGNQKKKQPASEGAADCGGSTAEGADGGRHHWHLSDLLHPFQSHRK
ncbi:hypothetical protein DY245_20860 [Streptomyces inhibens]|uniref:C2H2-type domain-containing protein n=1 Tax=Streptomyces inhibens TaxID=2293571 RepID=A0A371Q1K7_STRIH|nr:hypothetical protein [Streptomyces inhibens]REK88539.1 hypothetical protein DY245_20860 [Streptomyces inhibens]